MPILKGRVDSVLSEDTVKTRARRRISQAHATNNMIKPTKSACTIPRSQGRQRTYNKTGNRTLGGNHRHYEQGQAHGRCRAQYSNMCMYNPKITRRTRTLRKNTVKRGEHENVETIRQETKKHAIRTTSNNLIGSWPREKVERHVRRNWIRQHPGES